MAQARVKVFNSAEKQMESGWTLCFQYCRYEYADPDETEQLGYRFIWKKPNGNLQGARGQARIPSISDILELISISMREGWGNNNGEQFGFEISE